MKKNLILIFLCILTLGSCKKDYQKMVTEYERSLPDSVQVVLEKIDDIDHLVYIIRSNDIYRHNLDDNSDALVRPTLLEDEYIEGIYIGKENIAFLSAIDDFTTTKFHLYNLKTQKFKEVTKFHGTIHNDVMVSPMDSTISGYHLDKVDSYIRVYYDYDGNMLREEQEDDPYLGDFDVPSQKYWQCLYCGTVITSAKEPNSKGTQCPNRPVDYLFGNPHIWQCIGDAY